MTPKRTITIILGVLTTLLLAGLSCDAWVRSEEWERFSQGKEDASIEGWTDFLNWTEHADGWTRIRSPISRHVDYAHGRIQLLSVYDLVSEHDRDALCTMFLDTTTTDETRRVAERNLRQWARQAQRDYLQQVAEMPNAPLAAILTQAFESAAGEYLCQGTARIVVMTSVSEEYPGAVNEGTRNMVQTYLAESHTRETSLNLATELRGTSQDLFPFTFHQEYQEAPAVADSAQDENVFELRLSLRFERPGIDSPIIYGSEEGGPVGSYLRVTLDIEARGRNGNSALLENIPIQLMSSFDLVLRRGRTEGLNTQQLMNLMLDRFLHLSFEHLRAGLGLRANIPSNDDDQCLGVPSLSLFVPTRGRIERAAQRYHPCCGDRCNGSGFEPPRPSARYRVVVQERSELVVRNDGVRSTHIHACELDEQLGGAHACGDRVPASSVVDPGVYEVAVSDHAGNSFTITAIARPLALIESACTDAEQIRPGVPIHGHLTRDLFHSHCGGFNTVDAVYRLHLDQHAKFRCSVEASAEVMLYQRRNCMDSDEYIECLRISTSIEGETFAAGDTYIYVDAQSENYDGIITFDLHCDVHERLPYTEGERPLAGTIAIQDGTAIVPVDLINPLLVYAFTLENPSTVDVVLLGETRARLRLVEENVGIRSGGDDTAHAFFEAGTHYAVVSATTNQFERGSFQITVRAADIAPD